MTKVFKRIIAKNIKEVEQKLKGKTFVVTGIFPYGNEEREYYIYILEEEKKEV